MINNELFHILPDMRRSSLDPRTINQNSVANQLSVTMANISGTIVSTRPSFDLHL